MTDKKLHTEAGRANMRDLFTPAFWRSFAALSLALAAFWDAAAFAALASAALACAVTVAALSTAAVLEASAEDAELAAAAAD